jgi:hypothetical protein
MSARARLIRIADKRELWNVAKVDYESAPAAFSLWTATDSSLLRAEIAKGSEALALQMGEALYGVPLMMARAEQLASHTQPADRHLEH